VKPQVIDAVIVELAPGLEGALVVSIAAGISIARIESLLPDDTRWCRHAQHTGVVREGMSVISGGSAARRSRWISCERSSLNSRAVVLEERHRMPLRRCRDAVPRTSPVRRRARPCGCTTGLTRDVAQSLALQTPGHRDLIETRASIRAGRGRGHEPGGTTAAASRRSRLRLPDRDRGGSLGAVARAKELGS